MDGELSVEVKKMVERVVSTSNGCIVVMFFSSLDSNTVEMLEKKVDVKLERKRRE